MVRMTRSVPEVPNGPTALDVQEKDVEILKNRGWIVGNKAPVKEEKKPIKEEVPAEEVSEEKLDSSKKKSKF